MIRAFDIAFSFLVLVISLPFTILIAVAVMLSSQGPVFFVQERIGRGEKPFRLYKFRSMRAASSDAGMLLTVRDDSRITDVGRFLRRFKLDELPQFLNVLTGDMSVIGPRPEVPKYVESYTQQMRAVFNYRPGLTDPASIQYRNEPELLARAENPEELYLTKILPEKVLLSLQYQKERTALSDLKTILRTVSLMLGR